MKNSISQWSRVSTRNYYYVAIAFVFALFTKADMSAQCIPADGTIQGIVFSDVNNDGVKDADEIGLSGVLVRVHGSDGSELGTSTTDNHGAFAISGLINGQKVRILFSYSNELYPSRFGKDNATSVQFATVPQCNIGLGLISDADLCNSKTEILTTCFVQGTVTERPNMPTIVGIPYGFNSATPARKFAMHGETGSIWGLAYKSRTKEIFSSALVKQYSGLKAGHDAIFKSTFNGTMYVTSLYTRLGDLGQSVGTLSITDVADCDYGKQVGKIGLGAIVISPDEKFLYVVNIYNNTLVRIPTVNPTAANTVAYQIPGTDIHAFALKYHNDKIYVGTTEPGKFVYVWEFDPATGSFTDTGVSTYAGNDWETIPVVGGAPAHWLTDIDFTDNGDMLLSLSDRLGHAYCNDITNRLDDQHGDLLIAHKNPGGGWTMENRAEGEFFSDDYWIANPTYHPEITTGSILALPGTGSVVSTVFDPEINSYSGGLHRYSTITGKKQAGKELYTRETVALFGKATGFGDIIPLCGIPEIEIGNLVWIDTNENGIQDADEAGVAGLPIELRDENCDVIATTTTDSKGNYLFNSSNVTDGLYGNTQYYVGIAPSIIDAGTGLYAIDGKLYNLSLSNPSFPAINSDGGSVAGCSEASISVVTDYTSHLFDLGLIEGSDCRIKITKNALNGPGVKYTDLAVFEIKIRNNGNQPVSDIELEDVFPPTYVFVQATNPEWTANGNKLKTTLTGILGPKSERTIYLKLNFAAVTPISYIYTNHVKVIAIKDASGRAIPDIGVCAEGVNDLSSMSFPNICDLALIHKVDKEVITVPDYKVNFTTIVCNQGTNNATGFTVVNYLNPEFLFNPADNPGWTISDDGTKLFYTVHSTLIPSDCKYIKLALIVKDPKRVEKIINYAEIAESACGSVIADFDSTPDTDPDNDNGAEPFTFTDNLITSHGETDEDDHDVAVVNFHYVDLNIQKVTRVRRANPGDEVKFNIKVTNIGRTPISKIKLVDYLPNHMILHDKEWISVSGNAEKTIVFDPALQPGQSYPTTITVLIDKQAEPPILLTNNIEINEIYDDLGNDVSDPNKKLGELPDGGGSGSESDDIYEDDVAEAALAVITPLEVNPCVSCIQGTTPTNGQFVTTMKLESLSGETWTVESSVGLYDAGSAAPPAAPTPLVDGFVLTEVPIVSRPGFSEYRLTAIHLDGQGFSIRVTNEYGDLEQTSRSGGVCRFDKLAINGIQSLCRGTITEYTVTGAPAGTLFTWYIDDAEVLGVTDDEHEIDWSSYADGEHTIKVIINSDCVTPAELTIAIGEADRSAISCHGTIQVSLDGNCSKTITPQMLAAGTLHSNYPYIVTLTDAEGNVIPNATLTKVHIGTMVMATLLEGCGGNSCWTNIVVEDKTPPVSICQDITLPCYKIDEYEGPFETDNCGGKITNKIVEETYTALECDPDYIAFIDRSYRAVDQYGNESPVCRMRIRVARPDLSLIKWPESFQTSAGTALQCNTFELNDEGHPDISVTGIPYIANVPMYPSIPGLCNLSVGYVDRDLGYIKCTRKIIRTWYVYEQWCSSTDFIKFDQMLEIVDKTAPIIAPIEDFSVTVNGNKICEADIQLPQAVVTDDCNNQGLTVTVTYPGGFIDNFDGTQKIRLGLGDHIITYRAYDLCKNSSSVSFIVSVIDETPPVMACKGIVVVGLNSLGVADLYPRHIDDGSYDGCGIDYFDVARMPEQGPVVDSLFGPFVTFNCADVGKENIVILRAWDISGNNNSCMMTVEVQDKHAPKIACPADLTIDCSEVFDGMDLTQYGSATAIDVCGAEVAELNPEFSLNACRVGTILRHFTASDNANTVMCTQTITVENNYDFDPEKHVIKPQDYIVTNNACSVEDLKPENLPDGYGAPVITQTPCSLAAASYKDEIFDIVTGACYKILRTWTVIDWCEMEAAGSNYVPYKFQQTIMVNNTIPPIFVDQEPIDTTFYTDKGVCDKGRVRLTFVGRDDCTPDNKLKWSYYLDYFDEGVETVTNIGSGPIASLDADLPVGTHRILWSFEDQCGNIVTKGHLVTVVNNDAPQAVALDSIAVAIVPCDTDGDGLPDLEKGCITAESLNVSSSSLCCTDPLIFSFSEDITDTVRCFTCLDVNYPTFVELWVTDCNGNTDKVIVEVDVQDNNDSDICEKICENFPAVAVISGVDEVCIGEEVTLTASGGGTYHWSTGATTPSITVQPNTTTTYSVTVTNEYRCTDSESITVTVHQLPVISIAGEDICLGESTTLTASGGSTYIWSTGETTPSITVSPLDTTTYSVTATDDNGCEASTSREVIVFPLPEPEITGNMFICVGSSTTLTASGGVSYVWSTGESTPSITVSPSTTTTYSVTVTNDFGCTASTSKTVTVNGIALQASINGDDVICSGESTTLQAQLNGGNPVSYAWNTGATSSTITVSPSSNTTYVVTITDINGCTSSASKLVTVNPLPAVSIDGQDVCLNSSTTLTASGGTSYVWSTGETTPSITVSPLMNTTYTVTATNNFGCTAAASKTVNVLPLPVVTITGDLQICLNEVTTLTASGGVSYVWSTGETTSSIDVSPVVNTTYTVTATDANGCSNTASATVIVNGLSINASITGDDEICLGESTVLTAELSGGTPLSYLWNTGETTASITVNPSVTSTFSVTITDINGCEGRASITVTVHPLPDITIVGDDEICIGTSTTLTASGGVSYLWSTGDSTPEITVSPTNTTTYTVTVTTDFGCTASASITVNVLPLPVVSISGDQEICIGDTTTLTASGGSSYVWSTGETTSSIDVAPVSDTEYTVTATDTNGCSNTASVTVVVHGANLAASITGDDIICVNESTVLSAQLTGGTAATYLWSTGETSESITVNPSVTTSYSVTITDINGCSAEASIDITVNPLPVVIITGGFEVCPGDSTTLTASGGSAYVWSTGETTASITVSPTQNTTYTVTATDQNSCSNTAEATVIILPLPNADISGPDTICSGVATELIASGGVSYEWSTGETGTTITVSPTEATTYVVTVTDDKGCENTASHTVEIF
ncbi:MAG: PKD domain-containing protein [Bacteroidetes bacterium OLB9]|nr:MAG: PKD domain-containing protein [Bacteroidetes bacterium OLB9]